MKFLKNFSATIIFAVVSLVLAFLWGLFHGPQAGLDTAINVMCVTAILAVMELSLSFDNAVVNASILKHWDPFWQKMFLTVGIVVASPDFLPAIRRFPWSVVRRRQAGFRLLSIGRLLSCRCGWCRQGKSRADLPY